MLPRGVSLGMRLFFFSQLRAWLVFLMVFSFIGLVSFTCLVAVSNNFLRLQTARFVAVGDVWFLLFGFFFLNFGFDSSISLGFQHGFGLLL